MTQFRARWLLQGSYTIVHPLPLMLFQVPSSCRRKICMKHRSKGFPRGHGWGVVLHAICWEDVAYVEAQTFTGVCWASCITLEVTSKLAYNSRSNIRRYHQPTTCLVPSPSSGESLAEGRMGVKEIRSPKWFRLGIKKRHGSSYQSLHFLDQNQGANYARNFPPMVQIQHTAQVFKSDGMCASITEKTSWLVLCRKPINHRLQRQWSANWWQGRPWCATNITLWSKVKDCILKAWNSYPESSWRHRQKFLSS